MRTSGRSASFSGRGPRTADFADWLADGSPGNSHLASTWDAELPLAAQCHHPPARLGRGGPCALSWWSRRVLDADSIVEIEPAQKRAVRTSPTASPGQHATCEMIAAPRWILGAVEHRRDPGQFFGAQKRVRALLKAPVGSLARDYRLAIANSMASVNILRSTVAHGDLPGTGWAYGLQTCGARLLGLLAGTGTASATRSRNRATSDLVDLRHPACCPMPASTNLLSIDILVGGIVRASLGRCSAI